MSDIEVVIKIPEEKYEWLKKNNPKADKNSIVGVIVYGTPLPKGHGDIVDIETLCNMFWDGNSMEITKYDLSVIEPIIKADRTESNDRDLGL